MDISKHVWKHELLPLEFIVKKMVHVPNVNRTNTYTTCNGSWARDPVSGLCAKRVKPLWDGEDGRFPKI
jgi:hypothetical protein